MSDTTFVDGSTLTAAAWFNAINDMYYTTFGGVVDTGVITKIAFPATQVSSSGANDLDDYEENTFAPTVTLVGGAGNTVPVYTTNTGRHTKIGNRAFIDVLLTGDGGNEGAGTGVVTIGLPFTSSANETPASFPVGIASNGATTYLLYGFIGAGSGTLTLSYASSISALSSFTGADQNSASRSITLRFFYETAT